MSESTHHPDLSLPELLSARAHGASTRRLALDLGLGACAAAAVAAVRPQGWLLLASVALCFAAFGGWGLADRGIARRNSLQARELGEVYMPDFTPRPAYDAMSVALRVVEGMAVLVGVLAAGMLVFGLLALMMGTMIS